jgi:deoxyribodipyrimidine photo-lyase
MKKRIAIWFKNDLRLSDHPALHAALQENAEILPIYCLDTAQFYPQGEFGFRRTGAFRAAFLLESIKALDADLRRLSSGLFFFEERASIAIPEFVKNQNIAAVFTLDEFGTEEQEELKQVRTALIAIGAELRIFTPELLLPLDKQPFSPEKMPEVFTAYRHKAEAVFLPEDILPKPATIPSPAIPVLKLPALSKFGLSLPPEDPRSAFPFKAGQREAMKRLRYYGEESGLLSQYKETRNGLVGADYSSKLSPWLAQGNLSARMVYREVKDYEREFGANQSTYWLIFELRWRDFFRLMMLKHGKSVFQFQGFSEGFLPPSARNEKSFRRWAEGKTGQSFVDAAMRELLASGFMSNRMRQVVASYLIDYMKLDWRLGAAWFEEQLIDYDVSSNWCNWAYQAGVGNDPRGKRVFNPERQAEMYDPDGVFRKLWS